MLTVEVDPPRAIKSTDRKLAGVLDIAAPASFMPARPVKVALSNEYPMLKTPAPQRVRHFQAAGADRQP